MLSIWILLAAVNSIAWLLPLPTDQFGWALRVRVLNPQTRYLTAESVENIELEVVLLNHSGKPRSYRPLNSAGFRGELKVYLTQPKVKHLGKHHDSHEGQQDTPLSQLAAGHLHSYIFAFKRVGYGILWDAGTYTVSATLKTAEGMIAAPTLKLQFFEPKADDILESRPVALEGYEAKWPEPRQSRAAVQQIKIDGRTWLFYRQFCSAEEGGKTSYSHRICELPGKALDLKVEGPFGGNNPLTITYRETTYTKFTTTHVINSVDGLPWTAEEEKQRQEKLKREGKPAPSDK